MLVPLQRGEFVVSYEQLAADWNLKKHRVRAILDLFRGGPDESGPGPWGPQGPKLETVEDTAVGRKYRIVGYDDLTLSGGSEPNSVREEIEETEGENVGEVGEDDDIDNTPLHTADRTAGRTAPEHQSAATQADIQIVPDLDRTADRTDPAAGDRTHSYRDSPDGSSNESRASGAREGEQATQDRGTLHHGPWLAGSLADDAGRRVEIPEEWIVALLDALPPGEGLGARDRTIIARWIDEGVSLDWLVEQIRAERNPHPLRWFRPRIEERWPDEQLRRRRGAATPAPINEWPPACAIEAEAWRVMRAEVNRLHDLDRGVRDDESFLSAAVPIGRASDGRLRLWVPNETIEHTLTSEGWLDGLAVIETGDGWRGMLKT